jgi:hypothetical protein
MVLSKLEKKTLLFLFFCHVDVIYISILFRSVALSRLTEILYSDISCKRSNVWCYGKGETKR